MSDERIIQSDALTPIRPPSRKITYELTEKLFVAANRRDFGWRAFLPVVLLASIWSALFLAWGTYIGQDGLLLASAIALLLVVGASVRVLFLWIAQQQFLRFRTMYPHRQVEMSFSEHGIVREDAFFRSNLPWEAFQSINRSDLFWRFSFGGNVEFVPSECLDPDLKLFITTQAALHLIPVVVDLGLGFGKHDVVPEPHVDPTEHSIRRESALGPIWSWIIVLLVLAGISAWTFSTSRPGRRKTSHVSDISSRRRDVADIKKLSTRTRVVARRRRFREPPLMINALSVRSRGCGCHNELTHPTVT